MRLGEYPSGTEVILPNDLRWVNEFSGSRVAMKMTPTVTGAVRVDVSAILGARPIHLEPPELLMAGVTRSTVEQLYAWSNTPGRHLKLSFEYPEDTRQFVVMLNNEVQDAVSAEPILGHSAHAGDEWWSVKLKMIEVL